MSNHRSPEPQREMLSLVTARVRDAYVRKPFYVDGTLDLVSVCRQLSAQGLTSALVNDGPRLGIFTTTDLRDALLRDVPPAQLAVRDVARFGVIEIDADADLFEALWLMVRHRVHRLLVRDGDQVIGVLGQLDLVSFVANHSHIVALQIDEAHTVEELAAASRRVESLLALLEDGGIKIERMARLVNELNHRLFARAWHVLAPPEMVANTCLLVMGSEGRGEQILKTDQDNALLVRDGFEHPRLSETARKFHDALSAFGYPPCPGNIMLTNPLWCASVSRFKDTVMQWAQGSAADGPMNLAIFFDATAVAGDGGLLEAVRAHLQAALQGSDAFLARFAAAADQFDEPQSWWLKLTARGDEQALDLKKLGTFPIVHGVRALSLAHAVQQRGTADRITALVALGVLDRELGRDLSEALHYLMGLKLRHQLSQRQRGDPPGNLVRPSDLSLMDRDQFKDALAINKRFRALLRQRFRLDAL